MSGSYVWGVIFGLGAITFLIRFSFFGLLAGRRLPPLAERALRYVPSAALPALVAPMVALDPAGGAAPAPVWGAALVALGVGATTRHAVASIAAGFAAFHALGAMGL